MGANSGPQFLVCCWRDARWTVTTSPPSFIPSRTLRICRSWTLASYPAPIPDIRRSLSARRERSTFNLELQIDVTRSGRSFVYELSLLPVAIHAITLLKGNPPIHVLWSYEPDPRTTEINNLLAASCGTLTRFRVHGRRSCPSS